MICLIPDRVTDRGFYTYEAITMNALVHRLLLLTLLLNCAVLLTAQDKDREKFKFFCPDNEQRPVGFFVGLGVTNSLATISESSMDFTLSETTGYKATFTPKGKWGKSFEVGTFFLPRRGIIRIIDLGIGYRDFRGEEQIIALRNPGSDLSFPDDIISQGEFNYSRISVRLNLETVSILGRNTFFHQGPGLYMERTIVLRESFEVPLLGLVDSAPKQDMIGSLNYTVGLGFKLSKGRILDFYAHAPLISAGGNTKGNKELIYSSAYRSFAVGLRFKWLKSAPDRLCPAFDNRSKDRKVVIKKSAPRFGKW